MHRRVAKFCQKKDWHLSDRDEESIVPIFDELAEFLLKESGIDDYFLSEEPKVFIVPSDSIVADVLPLPSVSPMDSASSTPSPIEQHLVAIPCSTAKRPAAIGNDDINSLAEKFSSLSLTKTLEKIEQLM